MTQIALSEQVCQTSFFSFRKLISNQGCLGKVNVSFLQMECCRGVGNIVVIGVVDFCGGKNGTVS